jgi:zinc transporter ZupT
VSKPSDGTIDLPLALSILIGDAFHNFCDGVFIGVAFSGCGTATALTIVGVTLYHEIAQELADYFLLTRHAGLPKFKALLLNFCAGLSVVLGGLIVLAFDMSNLTLGVLLALASGVYLNISASECLPRASAVSSTAQHRVLSLAMFLAGAIPIGLTLINHTHCDAHGDEHEDHGDGDHEDH